MTSPSNSGGLTTAQQNGTSATNWDPSSTASSTSLNGSANLQQQAAFNLWQNPNYFAAVNSTFPGANSYNPTDPSYSWTSQWNAAADSRFPMSKLNVPSASSFNTNLPFMASLTAASMAGNAMRNSRRRRNLFSQNQVNELKRAFDTEPYVKPETRERLAAKTGLTPQQVKIWFQNNRYKCKQKQKEDDRVHHRTSTSFNDSGSGVESPSSSGNELSMTATNSPDCKLNIPNDNNSIPMVPIHPPVDTSEIKPFSMYHDFKHSEIPGGYPMPMGPMPPYYANYMNYPSVAAGQDFYNCFAQKP